MRKIHDVLRLHGDAQLSRRQIARCLGLAHSTVCDYLARAQAAGLSWPLPDELSQDALERLLFAKAPPTRRNRPQPNWAEVHRELRRKDVTLQLLWHEYKTAHPDGYQYSRFCDHYRAWRQKLDLVMRQDHRAGEKLFVDYAGQTVPVTDPETGDVRLAQVFVAVLGCSNYTFAEATWTQALPDWIGSHQRAFHFFGAVPELVVPDNLKSGVSRAHRYEPDLNPTYQDLATHYGVAVLPARVRRPRDKAKVEKGVQLVERWILACLRHRRFFSLDALNEAIADLLERLNHRPFKKLDGSRHSQFETLDRPAMRRLPRQPYVFAEWKKARVGIDYHVEITGHFYSVPYRYARTQIDVRLTETSVECFHRSRRIASHARSLRRGHHTTVQAHMPPAHRHVAEWTPERLTDWAARTGPATAQLIAEIMAARAHPQQGYRACLGIVRLGESHGRERLEAASRRALAIGARSYRSMASILKHGLDEHPLPEASEPATPIRHANIRGARYYSEPETGPSAYPHHHLNPNQNYEC
jgi:transposase